LKNLLAALFIIGSSIVGSAQDLEPRFLSSMPLGTNFSGLVYGYSLGNILINSLEIEDLNVKLNSVGIGYGRSLKLFNKPGKFDVAVPYSFGNLNALVNEVDSTVYRSGFMDPTLRLSLILVGEKPLNIKEFASREINKFKLGTSFKISFPLGKYDSSKYINLGANRWAFQLKVAGSYFLTKKLIIELHIDSWFFTENNSYIGDNSLKQDPLLSTQLHIAYLFNPKLWASVSLGQLAFGKASINGVTLQNNQKNSKYGATISYNVGKRSSLKVAISDGLLTYSQADFTTFLVGYSFLWFDKLN
jgi:hypothetical protein